MRRRLGDERGMALILALLVLVAIGAGLTTVVAFSSAADRTAKRADASQVAYNLAEAGINSAVAALHGKDAAGNPVNAVLSSSLPSVSAPQVDAYPQGTDTWYGSLDPVNLVWTITSTGAVANPAAQGLAGSRVTRTLSAQVNVTFDFSQTLDTQAWNYLYATHTGSSCDEILDNPVSVQASLYVEGNLCLRNTANVMPGTAPPTPVPAVNLVVKGSVTTQQSSHIGQSGKPITSASIANGCNGHSPCLWNGGGDPVWASSTSTTAPAVSPPTPDWTYWYQNAVPGPMHPCGSSTGGAPTWDDDAVQFDGAYGDGSAYPLGAPFDLTPSGSDYSCVSRDGAGNLLGELAWNHTTQTLTVDGAVYIDGSATVTSSLAQYVGQATLYLSGVFSMAQQAKLCGGIKNGTCDFGSWNPNTTMLIVVAHGDDQTSNHAGITLNNSIYYQGGLEATNNVVIGQSAIFEGPMIGGSLIVGNTVNAKPFPLINTVPIGTPGNPNVYADAQNPVNYTG